MLKAEQVWASTDIHPKVIIRAERADHPSCGYTFRPYKSQYTHANFWVNTKEIGCVVRRRVSRVRLRFAKNKLPHAWAHTVCKPFGSQGIRVCVPALIHRPGELIRNCNEIRLSSQDVSGILWNRILILR